MSGCLDYQKKQYDQLHGLMYNSTQNVLKLQAIVRFFLCLNSLRQIEKIERAIGIFSKSIQNIGEEFHLLINGDNNERDVVYECYSQLSSYLLRLAQSWISVNNDLKKDVIDPYGEFIVSYRQTNRNLSQLAKEYVRELELSREQMGRAQSDYCKMMANSEKATNSVQQLADRIGKGNTKEDFQKMFQKSCALQNQAKEADFDYKTLIEATNKKWENFSSQWAKIFNEADQNDLNRMYFRIKFTKESLFSVIKSLSSVQWCDPELLAHYHDKFDDISKTIASHQSPNFQPKIERNLLKNGGVFSSPSIIQERGVPFLRELDENQ